MDLTPIFDAPTKQELHARIARLQEKMIERRLDWYVSVQPDNVYYLTNFANFIHERPFVLLIPAQGIPHFVAPKLEIPHIRSRVVGEIELVEYFEFPAPEGRQWSDRMKSVLGASDRVGVESVCPLQIYDEIGAERVRADLVDDLRLIKSAYEVGRMVYSAGIANAALQDFLAKVKVGRSLSEIMAAGKSLMMGMLTKDNPNINPFATRADVLFQPARYSDDPHNFSDLAMCIEDGGPNVTIVNAVLNGYGAEVERTFFVGLVPEAAKRPYEVMMLARRLAFDMARPGTPMCDLDRAVNDLFEANGYADNLLHRTGHGMGVTGHEAPFLAEGDTRLLEPGMSVTIEPGVYLPGVGGFRHSDTILITQDGSVSLTSGPDTVEALTL
ncbi:Xaa-Pro peptidase family protein [Diaphorobacter sp. LR2014-1]|uniref:M24 family metallopeptidase n=1 Tax=Diaphorobacter sp. LR2014-1 TaxID=1933219 RepID=UPI000CDB9373|nr:Xaa-Pro peptidase family protein [Diaphorobacter sp. LR2014-1]POR06032.1 peptidase M24 [Diaphorobacter sp. LR2014-1]